MDLFGLSVTAIFILLGSSGLFLVLGGRLKEIGLENMSDNGRLLVGVLSGIFLTLGLVIVIMAIIQEFRPDDKISGESIPQPTLTNTPQTIVEANTETPTPTDEPTSTNTPIPTATSTPTPTNTAVSKTDTPEPEPTATNTPILPTDTAVPPTATNTPIPPSPTNTPASNLVIETDMYTVDTLGLGGVNFYTRDSDITGLPRGLVEDGDIVQKLGENDDGTWYHIQVGAIDGWLQIEFLVPFDGTVMPTPLSTPDGTPPPTPIISSCVQVEITFTENPGHSFDDVLFTWRNAPSETARLNFSVFGIKDGANAFVVFPTFTEVSAPYLAQRWMFSDRNFSNNSTFTYRVEVWDSSNTILCTTTGSFEQ